MMFSDDIPPTFHVRDDAMQIVRWIADCMTTVGIRNRMTLKEFRLFTFIHFYKHANTLLADHGFCTLYAVYMVEATITFATDNGTIPWISESN